MAHLARGQSDDQALLMSMLGNKLQKKVAGLSAGRVEASTMLSTSQLHQQGLLRRQRSACYINALGRHLARTPEAVAGQLLAYTADACKSFGSSS